MILAKIIPLFMWIDLKEDSPQCLFELHPNYLSFRQDILQLFQVWVKITWKYKLVLGLLERKRPLSFVKYFLNLQVIARRNLFWSLFQLLEHNICRCIQILNLTLFHYWRFQTGFDQSTSQNCDIWATVMQQFTYSILKGFQTFLEFSSAQLLFYF